MCKWERCDKSSVAQEFCSTHYYKAKKAGLIGNVYQKNTTCSKCNEKAVSKGFCFTHYTEYRIKADAGYINKGRDASRKYQRTWKGRYRNCKAAAIARNYEFSLTFEQYFQTASKPCYYCSGVFDSTFSGSHLDRVINNVGYTVQNIVSCCKTCNLIKNDSLSKEEAYAAIQAAAQVRLNKKENICG